MVSLTAGGKYLVAELVGLDQVTSAGGQSFTDEAFSAGKSTGESYLQHCLARCSAEATVFAMSMAMVRGPTPPGTGV